MSPTKKRKAFRSKKGTAKKARKEVEQISEDVLGQFWDLPSDAGVNKKAAALLEEAVSSMCFIETHGEQAGSLDDNILERLITGATSSGDRSYQAFALALDTICNEAQSDVVTERAFKILCNNWATVSVQARPSTLRRVEERLAFLCCCAALVRGPHAVSGATARDVLKMLCEIASEQESWHLATTAVKSVAQILQKLEDSGQLELVLDIVDGWLSDRIQTKDGKLLHQLCLLRGIRIPPSLGRKVPRKALLDCLEPDLIRTGTQSSLPWLWELTFRNAARESSENLRRFWIIHVRTVFTDPSSRERIPAMFWVVPLLIEVAPSPDDILTILSRKSVTRMDRQRSRISWKEATLLGDKMLFEFEQRSLNWDPQTRFTMATFLCNLCMSSALFSKFLKRDSLPLLFGNLDHAAALQGFVKLMRPVVDHVDTPKRSRVLNSDKALRILEMLVADFHWPILDEVMHYVLFCHGCSTLDSPELVSLVPDTREAVSASILPQLNRLVYAMFSKRNIEQRRALVLRLAEVAGNFREERTQRSPVQQLRDKAIQLCLSLQVNTSGSSSASLLICAVIILEAGAEELARSVGAEFLEVVEKEHVSSGELLQSLESQHAIVECIVRLMQVPHDRVGKLLNPAFGAIGHFVTEGLVESVLERILDGVQIDEDASDVEELEDSVHGDEEAAQPDGDKDDSDRDQAEEEMSSVKRAATDEGGRSGLDVDVHDHSETEGKGLVSRGRISDRKNEEGRAASTMEDADESDESKFGEDVVLNNANEGERVHKGQIARDQDPAPNLEEKNDSEGSEFDVDAHVHYESTALGQEDMGLDNVVKRRPSRSGKLTTQYAKEDIEYRVRGLELLRCLRDKNCPMWREVALPSRLIELASKCPIPAIVRSALSVAKTFMKIKVRSPDSVRTSHTVLLQLERISRVVCSKWRSEVSEASEECLLMLCEQVASLPGSECDGVERMQGLVSEMLRSLESSTRRIGLSGDTLVEIIRRQPRIGLALVEDLSAIVGTGRSEDIRSVAIQALTIVMNDSNTRGSEKLGQIESVFHNAVRQAELAEPKPLKTLMLLGIEGATHGWNKQALSMSASALEHATKDHRELEKLRKRLSSGAGIITNANSVQEE